MMCVIAETLFFKSLDYLTFPISSKTYDSHSKSFMKLNLI